MYEVQYMDSVGCTFYQKYKTLSSVNTALKLNKKYKIICVIDYMNERIVYPDNLKELLS